MKIYVSQMLYFFPVVYKVALKLHSQFSHLHSERLLGLLQDCEKNNQQLESHMKDLDEKC